MAAPNGPYSYREDVSEDISQKICLLQEQERKIETLETQIKELRWSHAILEEELMPYCVATSLMLPEDGKSSKNAMIWKNTPIEDCPEDVLGIIFSLCIEECHSDIAVLLQVCRRWHRLIMDTPTLWARLQINETNYNSFTDPLDSNFDLYSLACMAHSKGLPFTVDLDFSRLPLPEQLIEEILRTLPYFQDSTYELKDLATRFAYLSWNDFMETGYYRYLRNRIHGLIIFADPCIQKCRSLNVVLPVSNHVGHAILGFLQDIGLKPSALNIPHYYSREWEEIITEDDKFGNLSDIEALVTYDLGSSLKLGIPASTIRHLELWVDNTGYQIADLSLLSSLLTLTLHGSEWTADMLSVSISLPTLRELSLRNCVTNLCNLDWNLPILEEFALCEYGMPAVFPQISALNLQLIEKNCHIDQVSDTDKQSKLSALMALSSSVQTLTVPSKWRAAAIRAIIQHRSENQSTALYKLVVIEQQKAPEEMYMRDLAE